MKALFASSVIPNWPIKMICVVIALILFVFHRTNSSEERLFSVPLIIEIDDAMTPSSVYNGVIHITLRGEPSNTRAVLAEDIEAYIDLRGKGKGVHRAPVQTRKKGASVGIEPLEISVEPLEIALALDFKISKHVQLNVSIQGVAQQGYELVSYTLTPHEALIEGPLEVLDGIESLSTDSVAIDGRSGNFSVMVNIISNNPLVRIRGTGMAEFQGAIQEIIHRATFDDVPISITGLDQLFSARLGSVRGSVSIEGTQLSMQDYQPDASLLFVDCSSIQEAGTYTLPVSANLPLGMRLIRQEPETLIVRVSER
jgi:YbbR domain-containing protein